MTAAAIVPVNPVRLGAFTAMRREATRALDQRGEGFEAAFDDDTLFFDVFDAGGAGREIIAAGPPLFNLAPLVQDVDICAAPGGAPCRGKFVPLDRALHLRIEAPQATSRLALKSRLGAFEAEVSPCEHQRFAGRRVLFTLSKNNRLEWIQDWIRYHRDIHGADAVLIYDNASTDYDAQELAAAIGALAGVEAAAVVPWPFKYGPQATGAPGTWDSDFCQLGMLEHARWRFLQRARSVLNADIDELVVGPNEAGVFSAVERSLFGVASFYGYWLYGVSREAVAPPARQAMRHRDFFIGRKPERKAWLFSRRPNQCRRKWAVVPARCPRRSQWRVHAISKWPQAKLPSARVSFRHFHAMSTNWRYLREIIEPFDAARHEIDVALKRNFDRVDWDR